MRCTPPHQVTLCPCHAQTMLLANSTELNVGPLMQPTPLHGPQHRLIHVILEDQSCGSVSEWSGVKDPSLRDEMHRRVLLGVFHGLNNVILDIVAAINNAKPTTTPRRVTSLERMFQNMSPSACKSPTIFFCRVKLDSPPLFSNPARPVPSCGMAAFMRVHHSFDPKVIELLCDPKTASMHQPIKISHEQLKKSAQCPGGNPRDHMGYPPYA